MKKILLLISLLFTIISYYETIAFEFKGGDEVYVTEQVNDDLYIAGGSIDISVPINGDLYIAGGDININSKIAEDLIITGGQIVVSGNVGDDVRIGGGNVEIRSNIDGDLIVGAGTVRINKGVIIKGDLIVGAGRIILDGNVDGNVKIAVGQLVLNGTIKGNADIRLETFSNISKTGIINGNLKYISNDKLPELEKSSKAQILFEKNVINQKVKSGLIGFISTAIIIKIIGLFLFSTLIYFYFKKYLSDISDNLKNNIGKSFLHGFLIIIGTPLIILLLFISVIGIPFAFLSLFIYIFLFVFLNLINVIIFTSFFIDKYHIKDLYKKLLVILGLTFVFGLINGISFIVGFFTLGAIAIKKLEIIEELRKDKK